MAVGTPGFDGRRLRAARRSAGLTQAQLAQQVGVPTTGVANWETGYRAPRADRLAELARLLGVPPSELTSVPTDRDAAIERLRLAAGQYAVAFDAAVDAGWGPADLERLGFPLLAPDVVLAGGRRPAVPGERAGSPPAAASTSLAQLRVFAGLLQDQAAARAGLTRTKYSALERGEIGSLSAQDSAALADAFGVDVEAVRAAHAVGRAAFLARPRTR